MKKILVKQSFLLRLRNAEHYDLMEAILDTASTFITQFSLLKVVWNHLKKCFEEEDIYFKLTQRNEATKELEMLEKNRNRLFRKIKQIVKLSSDSKESKIVKAVEDITFLLQIYKETTYLPHTENSAYITNFLQDITSDKYESQVNELELQSLIGELEIANNKYKEVFRLRTTEEYTEITQQLMKARKNVDLTLEVAADDINSLHQVKLLENPDSDDIAKLLDIIHIINAQLDKAESIYARRIPNYKKNKDGDDDDNKPKPEPEKELIFTVKEEILNDFMTSDRARSILIKVEETKLLAEKFYPQAQNSLLFFKVGEEICEVMISKFMMDENGNPIGLLVSPPINELGKIYFNPIEIVETGYADIIKNDVLLARVKNFGTPKLIDQ